MGGRIPLIIEGYQGLAGAIQGGNLKPLAVASAERLPDFPDVPTVAETVPGFKAMGWQGLVAPVGTPEAIVRKASEDLRKVVSDPALKAQLAGRGSYPRPMSPAEVTAFIQDQQRQWSPLLQQLSTKP
jgi:tripartite-type tricarboxylate transporter receptor subunit TctC